MVRRSAGIILTCTAACVAGGNAIGDVKPHILMILADDYGWANLGYHRRDGSKQAQLETHTPNLDHLIDEGIFLNRHYAYKICSPSRSSLQSGRLAVHVNTVNTGVTVHNASDPVSGQAAIPRNMTGMAQKLKEAGYSTHMVGKWDAGMAAPEQTPKGKGYDSWVGYYQHANDYWRKNMPFQATGELDNCFNSFMDFSMHNSTFCGGVRDAVSMSPQCLQDPSADPACYEEEAFKLRALQVIKEHDPSSPLFLFYSFHLLHTPLQVHDSYLQKIDAIVAAGGGEKIDSENRRLYAAMTLYMDEAVGEVVAALKAKGMYDNTLIVFSSDNGGPIYVPGSANNHPLRGGKYSDWEGGIRVNAFVSGGLVPSDKRGTVFDGVMSIADWYGTFCELAGVDQTDVAAAKANEWLKTQNLPLLPPVDSVPVWGYLLNGSNPRPTLHISADTVLQYPYKLLQGKQTYARWQGELFPNCTTIDMSKADMGPAFHDLKVFDHPESLAYTEKTNERIQWIDDCADGCLFNVEKDPAEHENLAQDPAFADTLAKLQAALKNLNINNFNPARGVPGVNACLKAVDMGGYYGPYIDADDFYTPLPPVTPGQYQKDEKLKALLKLENSKIVEFGIEAVAKTFLPLVRKPWAASLDKCLKDSQPDMLVV